MEGTAPVPGSPQAKIAAEIAAAQTPGFVSGQITALRRPREIDPSLPQPHPGAQGPGTHRPQDTRSVNVAMAEAAEAAGTAAQSRK